MFKTLKDLFDSFAAPTASRSREVADDSVTLGWTAEDGSLGAAAITRHEYERYVKDGSIRVSA